MSDYDIRCPLCDAPVWLSSCRFTDDEDGVRTWRCATYYWTMKVYPDGRREFR